ncbi:GNAT family N-acetyltransferase (plasmid) [Deinococcus sp. KNUC1210]|uniref:GNAT family N-acetyltransferase n=1 Tax=Deinococcus sp. KNUC1210 TaxID=2917691 RepID=UPI001EF12958|nr:GNAT family N-acetyltransferase [Deinococcus sp. KNUC1210]ULH17034.1 GNAT family N-acetyltransferase [Deinococcus sp. KNUC1210]
MPEASLSPELTTPHITPLRTPADIAAFRTLNEAWIAEFFTLEDTDRQQLGDPLGVIVQPGGQIFMAYLNGTPVGCVALRPSGESEFEVSKMAVAAELRGQGIGRLLLSHTIEQARQMGARRLVLGSSTRLGSAVHLYERLGFQHVPVERRPVTPYARADVFMELDLD